MFFRLKCRQERGMSLCSVHVCVLLQRYFNVFRRWKRERKNDEPVAVGSQFKRKILFYRNCVYSMPAFRSFSPYPSRSVNVFVVFGGTYLVYFWSLRPWGTVVSPWRQLYIDYTLQTVHYSVNVFLFTFAVDFPSRRSPLMEILRGRIFWFLTCMILQCQQLCIKQSRCQSDSPNIPMTL